MRHIRKRLTYANVMSSISVFLVIGGATAFAALGKNTVGTKQLKKNAVIGSKVKNGSLTGADLKLSTLGTVPSATNASHADNATNANHATSADNAAALGGKAPSAFEPRVQWATVKSDGTILEQSGGISMLEHVGNGYYLDFGSTLIGRGASVSFRYLNPDYSGFVVDEPCAGLANTFACSPPGATNNPNVLFVQTHNASNSPTAEGFNVLVTP